MHNVSWVHAFLQNSIYNAKISLLQMQAVSKFSIININKMCTFFRGAASLLQSPNGAGEIKQLNSGTLELLDSGTGDVLDPGAHKLLNSGAVALKLLDSGTGTLLDSGTGALLLDPGLL